MGEVELKSLGHFYLYRLVPQIKNNWSIYVKMVQL